MHRILQVGLVPKDNLEQWLKQEEIQHITVLEPHPQLVQQLQQQYSGQAKLQVVAAALSPNPGLQTLIDYSLPGFSSLSPATGLKRLFPGLQDTQHLEVNALSPTHFLEQYGPESGQTATLVIHAKGYEAELIQELIRSPALLRFTDVLLYSAADSLYEHSADTAILQKQLIEAGYELLQEQVVSPEWTESYFKRNAVQDEIVLLRQQLKNKEQLEVALAQSQSEIQALQQAVVAEKSVANQHAQQAQKLQAVLENVKKEFNVFQAQLTTKENDQQKQRQQFQAALAAAESERQKAVALSEQLAADLQQTKQANQAAEIAREQLQSELQALQKAVTTEKALADKQAEQAQKTQASLDEAKKELAALQAQWTTKENDQQKQRQQFEAALAAAESERQKAVALSEQLAADLQQTKQANQAAEIAREQLQSELQALQKAVTTEKALADKQAQQTQKAQASLDEAKKELATLQAQLTTKENDQQKQRQQFEAALAAAESERQKAVALSEQLAADLQQTKQANQAAEIAREQLQSELQALQKAVTTEKALAEKQAEQAQKTQASLDEAKKELIALQAQLTTKENDQKKQRQQFEAALAAAESERQKAVALAEQQTQQLKTLQAELEQAKQEISLTLENSKKELIAKDKSLAAQQQELISAKKNQQLITEQLQTTEAKLKEHEQWLRNRKKQVEELEQALQQEQQKTQQLQTEKGALAQLESRMEQLFNQQATQIQQATNALGKHVTKSFVDQRQHDQALTGLYQYLEKGEQPLSFDAWSMGVDTLTYLVRQIEQNNYDVIIEFGSGTSTVVMAKAVAQRLTSQRYSQITKNDNSKHLPYEDIESHAMPSVSGSQATTLLDSAEYDLPRQILSFEQDRNYLNQTKQALASHGVSQVVELVLAPLVPSRYSALPSEQKPLFYDCEKQLERLARLFEQRNARILVVVDGPFSPKNNPLIREPALGTVLQYLSAQHLDILLDDSHRSGEQQVLEHWQELCEERGLTYKVQALDVVKGATWVTVRPE